ncbi:MAG: transposase family protein, partial [Patescibacteria group bacterium]
GKYWHLPHKKPKGGMLTKWQKTLNKRFAKERIVVEHGIRGIKIFRRVGEIITIKSDELFSTALLAAANLYNFKRLVRQGLG